MPTRLTRHIGRLTNRWGFTCFYCERGLNLSESGKRRATIDHAVPRSRGANSIRKTRNYVLACYRCNHTKADRTAEEFVASADFDGDAEAVLTRLAKLRGDEATAV